MHPGWVFGVLLRTSVVRRMRPKSSTTVSLRRSKVSSRTSMRLGETQGPEGLLVHDGEAHYVLPRCNGKPGVSNRMNLYPPCQFQNIAVLFRGAGARVGSA